jgi:hypothetical protein
MILRPKRKLSRQELRRYVVNRLTLNPRVVRLSRKRRRELARESLREVRKTHHGKVYVVDKPSNWFQFLKETFLPQWALAYWPVRYTEQ